MSDFDDLVEHKRYRAAALAGIFYPHEEMFVNSVLRSFGLSQNPEVGAACIFAPHGNWNILGNSIASAYKSLAGTRDAPGHTVSRVVLLGSIHCTRDEGLFVSESDYFETPLGNLTVDKYVNEELMSCNTLFELNDIPHLRENTAEVHFPFIKFLFPQATFVPLLVGGSKAGTISALASALRIVFEPVMDETLFIISSNLSSHLDPDTSRVQSEEFTSLINRKDNYGIIQGIHNGRITACGAALAGALLESGLLDNTDVTRIENSGGSVLDEDEKTIFYAALNFS